MHCTSCGTELSDGQKFCGSCGSPTKPHTHHSNSEKEVDTSELKAIIRTFHSKASEQERIVGEVIGLLEKDNLEVQTIKEGQTQVVQGRQKVKNIFLGTAK